MAKSDRKSDLLPTRNDVPGNAKQVSIEVLQGCLSDSVDLYNATRQAHWNVKGQHFGQLHKLFEEFYTALAAATDDLAERIVQLGGTANGTTQTIAGGTRLPPYPTDMHAGMDHVRALSDRYAQVAKTLREGIDATDEAGDADTADLLTEQSRATDKMLWMLEAHLAEDTKP
ncbi:DNA starvation/stationary phase protection protein Dps [Siccirubricoccus sp. KC 17139]|uniref:DNA starvation/stationary phase protection protein Dps n=1 Tax=Siccirubricoccus soli TaxID=2899147 RepID=A0ABT1D4A0_9PROT|nr:DNA starvation/stationary phase protection protein Dps [Siccirubricoccus soli]MCO6416754.1 DNA starvation/stationary phase protection protein Dps [Siccirubricoccus soli]MCP2682889.1 DNA starvation/stationary phase protection protein Dps [Siccirubricoccus soli]